jgi:acetyltransferase-like isoleucine patch superfamily enzyme
MRRIKNVFYNECRGSLLTFIIVSLKAIYFKLVYRKFILAHTKTIIHGVKNIQTNGLLSIGLTNAGFIHKNDTTLLNVRGALIFKGGYRIARGCRIDVGPSAVVKISEGGYINANTSFIIVDKLEIGTNCIISWNCQFLDSDFHNIEYENKKDQTHIGISIGNNVWIGCGVKLYKGTVIPDGCVIAADSIVRGVFVEKNSLIGGNPAKVIKSNITWF